jgi:sensor histidine kinase YesM
METDRAWLERYQSMDEEQENYIENRILESREVLTVYERMLLLNGVVVMNIDVEKYESLLDTILQDNDETVLYVNTDNQVLFAWNDKDNLADSFDLEEFEQNGKQDSWMKVGSGKYLIRTEYNQRYDLNLVSFIPKREKMTVFWQMIKLFTTIFVINALVMLFLAYATTKRTFNQLDYMIQVFHDAEGGIYPSSPKKDVEDEYDVIMNNIIYLFLNTIKLNEELNQKQHEQEVAELTALQLQINPHFLFNTLQTIQLEIRKNCPGSERSGKALDDLSDILKYALADPLETISLREEIEYLKRYVSIQQFRFGDKFIVYYEIEEDLMEFQVFRLMLQPLVENSILHGVRHKEGRGYIKLKIFKRGGRVNFRVIDNGCGMTKEECEKLRNSMNTLDIHHIGLNNVNSRLVLRFGKEASLIIRSKKGMGSAMEFSLPDN